MNSRRSKAPSPTLDGLLAQSPWFRALPPAVQAGVRGDLIEVVVPLGESLGRRGDLPGHWYGVIDGLFKWSVSSADGRSVSLGGQLGGSWFGEGTLIRQKPRNADVIALRDSRSLQAIGLKDQDIKDFQIQPQLSTTRRHRIVKSLEALPAAADDDNLCLRRSWNAAH